MNDIAIISYAFQKETIVFSKRSPISFAPIIADARSSAEINDTWIILPWEELELPQENLLAISFHPEITGRRRYTSIS